MFFRGYYPQIPVKYLHKKGDKMNVLKPIFFIGTSAVIGGLVFGTPGAIIGAAVAGLTLIIKKTAEKIFTHYYVKAHGLDKDYGNNEPAPKKARDIKVGFNEQLRGRVFDESEAVSQLRKPQVNSFTQNMDFGPKPRPQQISSTVFHN